MKTMRSVLTLAFFLTCGFTFAQPGLGGPGGQQGGGPGGQQVGQPGGQQGGQQGDQQGIKQGSKQSSSSIPSDKQIVKMVRKLSKEIRLSNDQETKVLELYKAHFAQIKAKTSGNSRPNREEMEAEQQAFEKLVKAELTREQITKYEAYLKNQTSKRTKR